MNSQYNYLVTGFLGLLPGLDGGLAIKLTTQQDQEESKSQKLYILYGIHVVITVDDPQPLRHRTKECTFWYKTSPQLIPGKSCGSDIS